MKKYLFIIITLLTSLVATSCQDEDFGFTEQEVFQGAYKRNFEKEYGKIDPNQSWDLSSYGKKHNHNTATRAGETPYTLKDGYYEIEQGTINWIESKLQNGRDNSSLGTSAGILMAGEEFYAIPLYQNGTNPSKSTSWGVTTEKSVDWTLNMIVLQPSATTVPLWSKTTPNNLQTINESTEICNTCHGHGMVSGSGDIPCLNCNEKGWLPGNSENCPTCHGSGTIQEHCDICNDDGKDQCQNCGGKGYTTRWIVVTIYDGCTECGGKGWSFFRSWGRDYELGNGLHSCYTCHGNKIKNTTCAFCSGTGKMTKCTICNGRGKGDVCSTCQGNKFVGVANWIDLPAANYNSIDSKTGMFRSKPWGQSSFTGFTSGFPQDSYVYFNLATTTTTKKSNSNKTTTDTANKSSLSGNMIILDCPRPSNIAEGYQVKIVGVDEDGDKDYNDVVFMIIGKPLPEIYEYQSGKPITTTIQKRYMIEDLGSSIDWDFNDIVVDVKHEIKRTLSVSNGIASNISISKSTSGTVRWLCGTIPLKITIGNTTIGSDKKGNNHWIQDPTDQEQTTLDLEGSLPKDADFPDDPIIGWAPLYEFENVQGYDPDLNNISVKVKVKNGDTTTEEGSVWMVSFPGAGETPYIIATDVNTQWMGEGENISSNWWNNKTENAKNQQTEIN